MKRQQSNWKLTLVATLLLGFSSLGSAAECQRPNTSNIYNWLLNMGNITFNSQGGYCLPTAVYQGLEDGKFSAISQLILTTHTMSACVKNVLKKQVPERRDSYGAASEMVKDGMCMLQSCFTQAFSTVTLAEMNKQFVKQGLTEAQKNQARSQIALSMYTNFQKATEECPKANFDDQLFVILGGLQVR